MEYTQPENGWYCHVCNDYLEERTSGSFHAPAPIPPHARGDEKNIMILIAVIGIITVIVPLIGLVFYVGSTEDYISNPYSTYEEVGTFPTIEVTLEHGSYDGDELRIKHIQGDPLDWSMYKIIITNNTDTTDMAVMNDLTDLTQVTAGDTIGLTESNTYGFDDIDYQKGKSYQLEFYNLKENKRVYNRQNIICE